MIQSWNKTCFTGGILEASFNLPGTVDSTTQLWTAGWLSGVLGRPGFGPLTGVLSSGDIWPYSYDTCDAEAVGMKYSACNDSTPANCAYRNLSEPDCNILKKNRKLLGARGRGMTEVDLFELFTNMDTNNPNPNPR